MNSTSPSVRVAKTDTDILTCLPVMAELRPHLKKDDFVSQVRRQEKQGYFLAYLFIESKDLENNKQIVAVTGARLTENLAKGKHVYIDDLVTAEKYRSKKYGEQLLEWIIQFAKEQGCTHVELDSGVQRYDAHRFYMNHRFIIVSHHFSLKL